MEEVDYVIYEGEKFSIYKGRLDLSLKRIKEISNIAGLDKLKNLEELDLMGNKIKIINNLDGFTNLKSLNLRGNQISKIEGLINLINLENLYLDHNQISEIQGLDSLVKLKNLGLRKNQIVEIRGLEALENLEKLYLRGNQITQIQGLITLINIIELDLSLNQITQIQGLETLINLQKLNLGNNRLNKIDGMESLKNLIELDVSENTILDIKNLENLSEIKKIYLDKENIINFINRCRETFYEKNEELISDIKILEIFLTSDHYSYNNLRDFVDDLKFKLNYQVTLNKVVIRDVNNNARIFNLNSLTIFIGRNNTGKTYALSRIYKKIRNITSQAVRNDIKFKAGIKYNPYDEGLDCYFIPKNRKLSKSNDKRKGFDETINDFKNCLKQLKSVPQV